MKPLIQFPTPYKYRGLPCSIAPDDKLWCISGYDNNGGSTGVLEWCYDEQDATAILAIMQEHPRFKNLSAHQWQGQKEKIHKMIFGENEGSD